MRPIYLNRTRWSPVSDAATSASPRGAMREPVRAPFVPPPPPVKRPVFLNPFQVRLPVTATVSLAHRISGILLVLATPALVYFLALSLRNEAGFTQVMNALGSGPGRAALVLLAWCLVHHTAAGIRHLFFDAGIGTSYPASRRTAWIVHGVAALGVLLALAGAIAWPADGTVP